MFNLLMTAAENDWETCESDFDRSRFLEFTHDAISARLEVLDDGVIAELKSMPALFCYERDIDSFARVGWITDIQRRQKALHIVFRFDERFVPIDPSTFEKILGRLDITHPFEMNRYHWAVKEVDLFKVLHDAGLTRSTKKMNPSDFKFSRRTILRASAIHRTLGHSDFDSFVLELGLADLDAGRNRGSRMDRANALADYAIKNDHFETANGSPVGYDIVLSAARIDARYPDGILPDVTDVIRSEFWSSLAGDGYVFQNGQLFVSSKDDSSPPERRPQGQPEPQRFEWPNLPLPLPNSPPMNVTMPLKTKNHPPKIFIVHGRDNATKTDVALFIQRLGLEAVILHDAENRGRTLTTKFIEVAAEADFAVVLLTPDDVG